MTIEFFFAVAFQAATAGADWRLVDQNDQGSIWVDENSISGPPGNRLVTTRLKTNGKDGFAFVELSVDCTAKRSAMIAGRSVDGAGNVIKERTFPANARPMRDYSKDADAKAFDALVCRKAS